MKLQEKRKTRLSGGVEEGIWLAKHQRSSKRLVRLMNQVTRHGCFILSYRSIASVKLGGITFYLLYRISINEVMYKAFTVT